MNEVERRGCVALEALEPCSSRLLQPCRRQPPLCAVDARAALLVVAPDRVLATGAVVSGAVVDIRRRRRSRKRAWGGIAAALPGRRVVLTAAAGAVEPVLSYRRSAQSGAGTRLCVRARPKSSCPRAQRAGSAQGPRRSGLPGSRAMIGCFSHRPDAPTCHPQRRKPASTAPPEPDSAPLSRHWPAVMTPRRAVLRSADAVASHRAADGAAPPIEA